MALNGAVVSDSTTLITLINIDRFNLLFDFSQKILIPPSVYQEVSIHKSAKKVLDRCIDEAKIIVMDVRDSRRVEELMIRLDRGESEAIVLAKEQSLPLIIDEKRGKKIASDNRLETIGLIGILLIYRRKNLLSPEEIQTISEELRAADFRISKALMALLIDA